MPVGGRRRGRSHRGMVLVAARRRPQLCDGNFGTRSALGALLERASLLMRDWPSPGVGDGARWKDRLEFAIVAALVAFGLAMTAYYAASGFSASAHPGGLAADGCHNDRKRGGRHCHGGSSSSHPAPPRVERFASGGSTYYADCSAARAAGAAPVRRGDPGYSARLDRDGDGVGCE